MSHSSAASVVFRRIALVLGGTACLALGVACRAAAPPAPAPVSPDTWATVNGVTIGRVDVDKAYRRIGNGQPGLSEEEMLATKLGLLDDLIVEEVLLAKARDLKIVLADSEVDKAYNDAKQNMSDEQFQQELTRRNLTAADMREGLRRQLMTQKVIEQEVSAKVVVSDQQVIDFFNANRAQFNIPEDSFRLAQIIVTPVRDQQIANRRGDDAGTPEAAVSKVAMVMERLKAGTPFSELAMDFSEDPESAPRGGDLGLIPISAVRQAPAPLRDAVLQMTPGSARVVNVGGAQTVVYLVAKEAAGQRDLSNAEVKRQITDGLKGRREQLIRSAYLSAARSDASVTNYLARRVVEAKGVPPGTAEVTGAAPAASTAPAPAGPTSAK